MLGAGDQEGSERDGAVGWAEILVEISAERQSCES